MKKILITLGLLLVVVVAFGFLFYNPDQLTHDNPAGKTIYYTKVENQHMKRSEDGRFEYILASYDQKGNEKKLTFTASKQLQEGAYLELYEAAFRGVTYWLETNHKDLPEKVKEVYKQ